HRLEEIRIINAQYEELLPSSGGAPTFGEMGKLLNFWTQLPEIPGYEDESIVRRGGVGVVYNATQLKLNRSGAINILLSGTCGRLVELGRFRREARAVASLRHTHIVQVYDVGEFERRPYYTMEFVEGGSLSQRLAHARLSPSDAASLIRSLAEAMHAAQ